MDQQRRLQDIRAKVQTGRRTGRNLPTDAKGVSFGELLEKVRDALAWEQERRMEHNACGCAADLVFKRCGRQLITEIAGDEAEGSSFGIGADPGRRKNNTAGRAP